MPFKVADVFRTDKSDVGIIRASDAFLAVFGNLTETENLEATWKNGLLETHVVDAAENNRSLMERTQAGIHHFTMMSLCAVSELTGRQPSGGPGRLATEEANLVFVAKSGNFKQIRNDPYRHDNISKRVVALIIVWDSSNASWFVDVQSVDNPFSWPIGTRVHHIYFVGGI